MSRSFDDNFGAHLFARLSGRSCLIDAATDHSIAAAEMRDRIGRFAAAFTAAGLTTGDRVMVGCNISPASTLAYLGALYAGQMPSSQTWLYAIGAVAGAMVGTLVGLRWLSQTATRCVLAAVLGAAGIQLLAFSVR